MKSKKFVLAALALLAITGLLALAGCKNDSVPEPTRYTVTFDTNGGTFADGEDTKTETVESGQKATRPAADPTLEGSWFLGWYSDEGLAKKFDFNTQITTATTVYAKWSYKLHTEPSILTNYTSPHAPSTGTWTYVEFGDWPQTVKAADVTVYEDKSKEMGMFTYYLGDDGNHYVKITAKPYEDTYTYSDGNLVEKDKEVYFKVEPIVWRVLTEDYKDPEGESTSNALLLAEKILTGGIRYYVDLNTRTITGAGTKEGEPDTVYPNNWQYSTIRAWLNGSYVVKGDGQGNDTTYTDKGFLQTAFTESAQTLIAETTVDNTAASTTDAGSNLPPATNYACANIKDKVFLLSEEEATTGAYLKEKDITAEDYGFDEYNGSGNVNTRIRVTTDYAKATGAYQHSTEGYGGWWWLRSPNDDEYRARVINRNGNAYGDYRVTDTDGGVVPALSISLGGN